MDRHPGFDAANQLDPVVVVTRKIARRDLQRRDHRDGNIKLRIVARLRAIEGRVGDADNGHRLVVDQNPLIQDAGIAAESRFPTAVRENHDGGAAGCAVSRGLKRASERRFYPKRFEKISRDNVAFDPLGVAAIG